MRILVANDGVGGAGGVHSYLAAVIGALRERGHEVAFLHLDPLRYRADSPAGDAAEHFCVSAGSEAAGMDAAARWRADFCFSHNMRALHIQRALLDRRPVIKMMHEYFGTCVGSPTTHAFPRPPACNQPF